MKFLLQISYECNNERNFENRSILAKVMDKSLVSCFLTHDVDIIRITLADITLWVALRCEF